jgi:hypothetical protein
MEQVNVEQSNEPKNLIEYERRDRQRWGPTRLEHPDDIIEFSVRYVGDRIARDAGPTRVYKETPE